MDKYLLTIDKVVRLLGDVGGRMSMSSVFVKAAPVPDELEGDELAYRMARVYGYLIPYGETHPEFGIIEKGDWVLSSRGWGHYNELKDFDNTDIPY
jgi:hypothetical protein